MKDDLLLFLMVIFLLMALWSPDFTSLNFMSFLLLFFAFLILWTVFSRNRIVMVDWKPIWKSRHHHSEMDDGPNDGPNDGPTIPGGTYLPSHILIIRHGNKPDDDTIFQLSPEGQTRAEQLVDWGKTGALAYTENKPISAIYTPLPKPNADDERPILTAMPLAFGQQLPVFSQYVSEDTKSLVSYIQSNPFIQDKAILIVYEHTCIQQLLLDLGIDPKKVPYWQSDDFASVAIVKFEDGTPSLTFGCENFEIGQPPFDSFICGRKQTFDFQVCK